ncbi:GNAT family N-acetyltransferase [Bizionia gelidisalsuginis]|uniref:GNAT family N-acetyltransferase n=2 Tax=Bizionia TaxID=283785 RepID=A0A8H2QL35_9FLAO|nr:MULTISPECIES: GNAT family N-acetyltransferase [Bizionia]TYB73093.1 GNAT family N-acetyltransferase [Bizionia saleffrena]TYC14863.1 GNAT family N-acetyltransferase [Bizionia gelidisalsuginis]
MSLTIVPFTPDNAAAFYNLNIEWLSALFEVEPYDEKVLSNPETYIINKGGFIFFAKLEGTIVGTFALIPLPNQDAYELTKMAVSPDYRGQKIGQQLLEFCIDFATRKNDFRLLLYSSRKLENAIHLYRKYGFKEIPVEDHCVYERCDIKMEYKPN